jgi:hypothetical protein
MATTVLHGNVNHCREAQDFLVHQLAAWDCEFGVVVKPYSTTNHSNWVTNLDESVALAWRKTPLSPPFSVIRRGRGHVEWGPST